MSGNPLGNPALVSAGMGPLSALAPDQSISGLELPVPDALISGALS